MYQHLFYYLDYFFCADGAYSLPTMSESRVLVTGAQGFVGRSLCTSLALSGYSVRAAARRNEFSAHELVIAELLPDTKWASALAGVDEVVHLAARAHVMREHAVEPLDEFRTVNMIGTMNLARQAAVAGVRRFVFVSSIGVNGAETLMEPFTEQDESAPHSPYAVSKHEAEIALNVLAKETGMEIVIIRPPLVYGADAPGNFGALMRAVACGMPLPLGAIDNRRSLVALDNLVDFIITCLQHPKAANEIFLVSDGEDVSTPELVRRLAHAMGRPARLISVPLWLLRAGAALLGKSDMAQRLCGSLQIDIAKARQLLGWSPPFTLDEGLMRAVQGCKHEATV